MRTILLLPLLAATSSIPAQNLLRWDGWQPWNSQYVHQLSITPTSIAFAPYQPGSGPGVCGLEQDVLVPRPSLYQFHFHGGGGSTGHFSASWTIGNSNYPFISYTRQFSWTVALPAGRHRLRFSTYTSNLSIDSWWFYQPILRPVVGPTVDLDMHAESMPSFSLQTHAHVLLCSLRRLSQPSPIPGFAHGLELDPTAGLIVLATSSTGNISISGLMYRSPPLTIEPFYLQAVTLSPPQSFGSRLSVDRFAFN